MIPTSIIDNFFESPTLIRDYALSLEFKKPDGNYPGLRTDYLSTINPKLFDYLNNRIMSIFYDFNTLVEWQILMHFQLVPGHFEMGWTHQDKDFIMAGVIYLNPEAPLNGGTLICEPNDKKNDIDTYSHLYSFRDKFYAGEKVDMDEYRSARDTINNMFETSLQVNNIYNRALIYNASSYHRENMFFGDSKESSRLTLVFFVKVVSTVDKTLLEKSKLKYIY